MHIMILDMLDMLDMLDYELYLAWRVVVKVVVDKQEQSLCSFVLYI